MTYKEIIWESLTKSRRFSALSAVRDSSQWKSNMKQIAMVHSRRLISTQSRSLHFLLLLFLTALLATHVATGPPEATAEGLFGSPQCQSDSLGAVRTKDACVAPPRPPAAPAVIAQVKSKMFIIFYDHISMQTQTDTLMRRAEKLNAAHLMTNLWIVAFNGSMNGRSDGKTKRAREISDVSVDGEKWVYAMTTRKTRTNHLLIFFDLFFGKSPLNVCEFMVIWDCITVSLNIEVHTARISWNVNGILKQKGGEERRRWGGSQQGRRGRPLSVPLSLSGKQF